MSNAKCNEAHTQREREREDAPNRLIRHTYTNMRTHLHQSFSMGLAGVCTRLTGLVPGKGEGCREVGKKRFAQQATIPVDEASRQGIDQRKHTHTYTHTHKLNCQARISQI